MSPRHGAPDIEAAVLDLRQRHPASTRRVVKKDGGCLKLAR